ncbi:hypothetical protein PUNSTDRAFT_137345 [Punctularia strigosozonata HHB-11173 SS5]|uniref:uncharacterized protein n=1 Tax=Punctularia strigosozonata (strain HHB-11173) TaxID=741275 RepID=UPI0004417787|nr:uncharacterized protein PUNSTDRAFT_137345 [Punctularia strigosozonata HHB-11173 SS5]EIN05858.1 hypothetical protein PUNSTDRAFT_137345 [Punctularia strigosozonata HHB-11173 SS5]
MRSFVAVLALFAALASQAIAFQVTFNKANISLPQLVTFQQGDVPSTCTSQCTNASSIATNCNEDNSCLCSNATVMAVTMCEQCLFNDLIKRNVPQPHPNVGSTPALTAYSTACSSVGINGTAALAALVLPSDWNGPVSLGLGLVGGIFAVGFGGIIGIASLLILCNL